MEENVRLKIKSVRYEVEASLFSDDESEGGFYEEREVQPESVEINTHGRLLLDGERVEISYDETEASGMEGSSTLVTYLKSELGVVSMVREGSVSTVLVFEAGKRHHCIYKTPFMPFQVCIHTLKVENTIDTDGRLLLDYVVEIRGAKAERTKFSMEVLNSSTK